MIVALAATSLKNWRVRFCRTMHFHYHQILRFLLLAVHGIYVTVSQPSTVIRCESMNFKSKTCPVPEGQGGFRVLSVTFAKQLSKAACTSGSSYGFSLTNVWVSKGCRANFLVQYEEEATSSSPVQVYATSTDSVIVSSSSQFRDIVTTSPGHSTVIATTRLQTMGTVTASSSSSIVKTDSSTLDLSSSVTVASSYANTDSSTLANSIHPSSVQDTSTSITVQTHCQSLSTSTHVCHCKRDSHVISIAEMIGALRLDKRRTSKSLRKKASANDSRIISVSIGVSSIIFLLVSAMLIVASDLVSFNRMITRQKVHRSTTLKTVNGNL